MRKALFILVIGSFAFIAETNAQQAAELFCGNNFKEGSGVSLKWLYNKVYAPQGFDVYRKDSDAGNWNKINDQPVVLQKTLSPGINLDKEATELYNALKNSDYETLTSMLRVFSLIKAIYSEELAVLLGIRYDDKTAANGNSYTYKITLSGSSEAICEEKTILCESYSKPNAPSGLKLTRSKEWIDITWQPEIYRYYAVDVYRKGLKDSTFQKITPVPRAIQKSQTVQTRPLSTKKATSIPLLRSIILVKNRFILKSIAYRLKTSFFHWHH